MNTIKLFDGLTRVQCQVPIEVKPVDQSLESLNSEVIYFFRYVGFCISVASKADLIG